MPDNPHPGHDFAIMQVNGPIRLRIVNVGEQRRVLSEDWPSAFHVQADGLRKLLIQEDPEKEWQIVAVLEGTVTIASRVLKVRVITDDGKYEAPHPVVIDGPFSLDYQVPA